MYLSLFCNKYAPFLLYNGFFYKDVQRLLSFINLWHKLSTRNGHPIGYETHEGFYFKKSHVTLVCMTYDMQMQLNLYRHRKKVWYLIAHVVTCEVWGVFGNDKILWQMKFDSFFFLFAPFLSMFDTISFIRGRRKWSHFLW